MKQPSLTGAQMPKAGAAPTSGSLAVLRQLNSSAVLEVLMRAQRPLRLAEIAGLTGLSRPTVETAVDGLGQQAWVVEDAADSPTRSVGRPARRFVFNDTAGHVLGVDIGANSVAVCLADLRGQRLATVRRTADPATGPSERLAVVAAAMREALRARRLRGSSVMAMTVGSPGTVSPANRRIGVAPAIPGWTHSDLSSELGKLVACDIELENDANLAVVGERARGVAHDAADVVFLLLGERLGAGVLVNGALVRGRDGAAGELGYVPVQDGRPIPAGFGPLESRVNATALVELGRAAMSERPSSRLLELTDRDARQLTAEVVTRAAAEGDPAAVEVLTRVTQVLAQGIAPALLTLNPEVLVIGGGISQAGRLLQDVLEPQLHSLLLYPPEIRVSTLGNEAVLAGAVHQATSRVQQEILTNIST